MTEHVDLPAASRVVLADANVLYSRVLRDYLLYAADEEIIAIAWSRGILDGDTVDGGTHDPPVGGGRTVRFRLTGGVV